MPIQRERVYVDQLLGKTPKLLGKVKSELDKIDDVTIASNGDVIHNVLRRRREIGGKRKIAGLRRFDNFDQFKKWRNRHLK
jgi:hypothetical protein